MTHPSRMFPPPIFYQAHCGPVHPSIHWQNGFMESQPSVLRDQRLSRQFSGHSRAGGYVLNGSDTRDMRKEQAELVGGESAHIASQASSLLRPVGPPYRNYKGILSCMAFAPISHASYAITPAHRSARDQGGNIPDQACSVALGLVFASFPLYWIGTPVQVGDLSQTRDWLWPRKCIKLNERTISSLTD